MLNIVEQSSSSTVTAQSHDIEMEEHFGETPECPDVDPPTDNVRPTSPIENKNIKALKKTPRRKSSRLVALKGSESSGSEELESLKKTKLNDD